MNNIKRLTASSGTTWTFEVPANSSHFVIFQTPNGTQCGVLMLRNAGNGASLKEMYVGAGVTISVSGNNLVITNAIDTTARAMQLVDIVLRGNLMIVI